MLNREDLRTVKEIAERRGRHPQSVEAFCRANDVPLYRFRPDRRLFVCEQELEAAAQRCRVEARP